MTDVVDPAALSSWTKDEARDEELTPEQELEKLRAEKKALQMRVLGVNELARLLQERTAELGIMEQKNKRLEVAVVRLENRCSNFEKKMKAQSGALPKSGQMPLIPGPSRQILDSLMLENAELKKVINKQTSKGPTSYLEAVKTYQLEEMVEQQRLDIEFYKAQLLGLGLSEGEDEKAVSMPAAGDPPGVSNTRALKLKVAKLQQTMRVKDKFCSLLSERVGLLEKQLNEQTSSHPTSPDPNQQALTTPPTSLKAMTDVGLQADVEGVRPRPDELVTLEQERKCFEERLAKKEAELNEKDIEIKWLVHQNEDLTLYNKTLVDDMKIGGEGGGEGETLQKELKGRLEEVQRKLERVEKEKRDFEDQIEHNHLQMAIIESNLTKKEKESRQEIQSLTEEVEILREDLEVSNNSLIEERNMHVNREVELQKLKAMSRTTQLHHATNRPMMTGGYIAPVYHPTGPRLLNPEVDRDILGRESLVDVVTHSPMVLARGFPDPPTHQSRTQTLPPSRPGNAPPPPAGQHSLQTHSTHPPPRPPNMTYTTGGGGVYNHPLTTGSHYPLTPSFRPDTTTMFHGYPQRGYTSQHVPPYNLSKSHPSTTPHPGMQQPYNFPYEHSAFNSMGSSMASTNSSGYFSSGVGSFSEGGAQGQSHTMVGPPQGAAGSQQQQQQQQHQGGSYHGHTNPQ